MIACLLITLTQILPFPMSTKYSLDSFPQTCLVFSQLCLNKWSTKCPGVMSDSCLSVPPHPIHQQALLSLPPKYITSVCLCPSPLHFWSKPRLLSPDYNIRDWTGLCFCTWFLHVHLDPQPNSTYQPEWTFKIIHQSLALLCLKLFTFQWLPIDFSIKSLLNT